MGREKKNWEKASASRFSSSLRELVDANYHSLESRDPADIQLFLVLFQPLRRTDLAPPSPRFFRTPPPLYCVLAPTHTRRLRPPPPPPPL